MSEWRYIAQRALTGEFLDYDVPLSRDELGWALSGAGSFRGTCSPDTGRLRGSDGRLILEEWGTLLYAEADGEIRWGGIVISSSFNAGAWALEAAGFATYPHGIPYTGDYSRIGIDPLTAFRELWTHVQSHPDGNLHVTVDSTAKTPVRLGTAAIAAKGDEAAVAADPYALSWWEAPDCGTEMDNLARETPFDFVERHYWTGDTIAHTIDVGYPRLGTRRADLSFVQGDNVISLVTPTVDGDDYANEVLGIGAGEGKASVQRTIAVRDGRLRRTAVYTAKDVKQSSRLDALIRDELTRRRNMLEITSITVRNHPSARIGSWQVGDDILVQAELPWLGEIALWCRITAWAMVSDDTATLTLARSDSFRYGG